MKATLFLSVLAVAFVMMACGGKVNNVNQDNDTQPQIVENLASNPEEVVFDVFDDVDWDRPLYSLDKNGDTTEVWRYDRSGKLVSYYELEGDSPLSIIGYRYDVLGRLIHEEGSSFYGNTREYTEDFTYKDNVCTSIGKHTTEGYPSFFMAKEVRYCLDNDFKYDTLCQEYEAEVSWDDYVDDEDFDERLLQLARYTTNRYAEINGETKIVESCFYTANHDAPGAFHFGYKDTYHYNSQGLLISVVHHASDGKETTFNYHYYDNVKDSLTYFARKSQFTTWKYEEPKENIVQKVAEQLLSEEYIEGLACQSKTVATVPVDDGETQTIACYQRCEGSWLVLEYWPTQGPENDKLSVYVLGKDGKLEPSDAQNLPLNLEGMRLLGSDLFFPYQGDELEFGKDYFIFPMEDGEPLRLEWNGEQFVVAK